MASVLGFLKATFNFFSGDAIILSIVVVAFVAVWLIEAYLASASKNVIAAAVFIALILVSITLTLARERAGRAR
ncbi:MAG TPA: hypothetical protein VIC85_17395 [Ktedonobacterales bacterium]|jgi:hypothetical protein